MKRKSWKTMMGAAVVCALLVCGASRSGAQTEIPEETQEEVQEEVQSETQVEEEIVMETEAAEISGKPPVTGMAVHVTADMLEADYWISKCKDAQSVVMTPEEIEVLNEKISTGTAGSRYARFSQSDSPKTIARKELLKLLNDFKVPSYDCYLDGEKVSSAYWMSLKKKMGREGLAQEIPVQYGFSVRRGNIRSLPASDALFEDSEDTLFDELQYSSILLNEPVIVLHTSTDGEWTFVFTNYACGWVNTSDIAVCSSFDEWQELQQADFAVITENKFCLDQDTSNPAVSGLELTMGVRLPLASEADILQTNDGRTPYSCYAVKVPVREEDGSLDFALAFIPASHCVSLGYLEYTRENVVKLAFSSLGERYGWGGMFDAKDCSQFVMELYRCFGIQPGRNTGDQEEMPARTISMEGLTVSEKEKLLDTVPAGAALYFPGHTMIYLGEEGGNYYVISDVGSMNPTGIKGEEVESIHTVTVNDLSVVRRNGSTWMECLNVIKIFELE